MRKILAVIGVLLCSPNPVWAQDPHSAEFTASADHNLVLGGAPVVTNYVLRVYAPGGTALAATIDLGKPIPDAAFTIIADITNPLNALPHSTNCNPQAMSIATCYSATVTAVGPGGQGVSPVSPPFSLGLYNPVIPPPQPPANLRIVRTPS